MLALNLDTKKANQQLRVVVDLPSGTGKTSRVAVFTNNADLAKAATAAGADIVGGAGLIAKLAGGEKPDFQKAIAGTDIIPALSKLGKILGPHGLMPSKKLGSVLDTAAEITAAVKRSKAGSVELRADRLGVVRAGIGKISMSTDELLSNLKAVVMGVEANRPSDLKGKELVDSLYVKSTMGPSFLIPKIFVDPKSQYYFSSSSDVATKKR